jgi:hypothetical protein
MAHRHDLGGEDLEDEHTKLLTYEFGRESAAARARVVEAMLTDLGRLSSDADNPGANGGWDSAVDDVERVTTELMMRQACYRAAAAVVANPVAGSLTAFLA